MKKTNINRYFYILDKYDINEEILKDEDFHELNIRILKSIMKSPKVIKKIKSSKHLDTLTKLSVKYEMFEICLDIEDEKKRRKAKK